MKSLNCCSTCRSYRTPIVPRTPGSLVMCCGGCGATLARVLVRTTDGNRLAFFCEGATDDEIRERTDRIRARIEAA